MINFQSLKLVIPDTYSFVGIEKRDDLIFFCLPKGFNDHISALDTFTSKRDLFFLFYRVLNTFKQICIDKGYLEENSEFGTQDRDGVINSASGSKIQVDEDGSENIFYSKLDIIGRLLNAYDEPKILALAYRLGKSDKYDLSQIHRYLHQAVYLHNHAAYVDQMVLPRRVVQFESTDIVTMYCYLFYEVKQQLGEVVQAGIIALAERFKQQYLGSEDSLFQEECYEQVLDVLKDALETIDHNTPIKDADYWQYYEAIELFLYGDWQQAENGEIWGIKNFHSVWESMCLTHLVQLTNPSLLVYLDPQYLDSRILEKVESSTKVINLSDALQINGVQLKPDAIVVRTLDIQIKDEKTYTVSPNNWDDYSYRTSINGIEDQKSTRVAYIGQSYEHTFGKLQELYQQGPFGKLIINARLPNNFYSFWRIPEQLNSDYFHKMCYFNHFFYLALEKRIMEWDSFYEEILKPLGIFSGLGYNNSESNAFTISLLRNYSFGEMKTSFNNFIQQILNQYETFFEIIDIKYLTSEYFCDYNRIEEIKRRSVRKQFVYEYLLQKSLERKNERFSNLSIRSSFWLPSYRPDDSELLEEGSPFMDGYIQLKNVNFMVLAENYLRQT
ncbi:hypothetical protein NDI49_24220 [Trichocoleus sp. ST-U3]